MTTKRRAESVAQYNAGKRRVAPLPVRNEQTPAPVVIAARCRVCSSLKGFEGGQCQNCGSVGSADVLEHVDGRRYA